MIAPETSPVFQKGFAITARLLLKKTFRGVYLSKSSSVDKKGNGLSVGKPLFLYSNHAAYQDALLAPIVCINLLGRRSIGPMEQKEFEKNKALKHVGIFGVSPGDGPAVELYMREQFQKYPSTCVWIHPEGEFNASVEKVLPFKEGLSRWSNKEDHQRVPMAIRYCFGPDSKPAVFLKIGRNCPTRELPLKEDNEYLRGELERVLHELNSEVRAAYSGTRARYDGFEDIL